MSGLLLWLAAAGGNDAPISVPTLRVVPSVSMTAEEIKENDDPCFVRVSFGLAGEASAAEVLACSPALAPRVTEAALTTTVEMTPTTSWPLSVMLRFDPAAGAVTGVLVGHDAVSRPTIRKGRVIVPEVSGVPLPRAGLAIVCPVHMVVLETGRTVGAQADASCEGLVAQRAVDAARRQRFIPAHNAAGDAVEAPYVARYIFRRKEEGVNPTVPAKSTAHPRGRSTVSAPRR